MTQDDNPTTMDEKVRSFSIRCLAFACVEGIMFSSSSALLAKESWYLSGLTFSNELISRDEGLHRDFAVELLKMCPPLEESTVKDIVDSAVNVECKFVDETLPNNLKGMNKDMMKDMYNLWQIIW